MTKLGQGVGVRAHYPIREHVKYKMSAKSWRKGINKPPTKNMIYDEILIIFC